jgi:hypothetical protein
VKPAVYDTNILLALDTVADSVSVRRVRGLSIPIIFASRKPR